MSSNITEISVLPSTMRVEGDLPVVQCLQCHQSLKEAAGQSRTLMDLRKEVKKLKNMILRADFIPGILAEQLSRRPLDPAETRVNFERQKRMRVSMSPPSKLARLNRLRLAASGEQRVLQTGEEIVNVDDEEPTTSSSSSSTTTDDLE